MIPLMRSSTYTVQDTFSFVSEITSFQKEENLVMASFDVSSLFTNIPLEESIDLCIELLFSDNDSLEYRDCSPSRSLSLSAANGRVITS